MALPARRRCDGLPMSDAPRAWSHLACLLPLVAAACSSTDEPEVIVAPVGPALAAPAEASSVPALGDIEFGDSPEAVARRADADPGLRRQFLRYEIDLPMGTYGLLPSFSEDQLVRLAILGPSRTRGEAAELLQHDINVLREWIERQHGSPSWEAPVQGEAGLRPRRDARWDLGDRVLTLGISEQDVLLRVELRIEQPRIKAIDS